MIYPRRARRGTNWFVWGVGVVLGGLSEGGDPSTELRTCFGLLPADGEDRGRSEWLGAASRSQRRIDYLSVFSIFSLCNINLARHGDGN